MRASKTSLVKIIVPQHKISTNGTASMSHLAVTITPVCGGACLQFGVGRSTMHCTAAAPDRGRAFLRCDK